MAKRCVVAILALSVLTGTAAAQSSQAMLRQLTRSAGYIFVGRVQSVRYFPANASSHVATVRVSFRVEQGLRGTRSGRELVIRQWAGLWEAGERYRTGERLLLFLYPSSKLGLTSPVNGPRGRFVVDRNGQVLLGMERAELLRDSLQQRQRHRDRIPLRELMHRLRGLEEE